MGPFKLSSGSSSVFRCTVPLLWPLLILLIMSGLLACGGGSDSTSNSSQSQAIETLHGTGGQLFIRAGLVDTDSDTIVIRGQNFDNGDPPVVTFDGGVLSVLSYSSEEIIADYTGGADLEGNFLLKVQTGDTTDHYDTFSLSIGIVDPQDPVTFNQMVVTNINVVPGTGMFNLIILGHNFTNGTPQLPVVTFGGTNLDILNHNSNEITAALPDITLITGDLILIVKTGDSLEQFDVYGAGLDIDTSPPPGSGCDPCWEEGPEDTNPWSGGAFWYEPLYYKLLHDYVVYIPGYFNDYWYMPLGYRKMTKDLREYAINDMPTVTDTEWGWDFIQLTQGGMLTLRKGYRWDGPTTSPLPYPSKIIRASMVHDGLYDLMRDGAIDRDWKPATPEGFIHRIIADCLLYMISKTDGRLRPLAWTDFKIVRDWGWAKTNKSHENWKFHAVADAGPDQTQNCGSSAGMMVTLDGTESRSTLSWSWEENGTEIGAGALASVFLSPGTHTITLTADDPNAEEGYGYNYFADSDNVEVVVAIDTVPPTITTPDTDIKVTNDEGQCSALIDIDVSATDQCGVPEIICDPPIDGPIPVGTNTVVCTAIDTGGNTDTGSFTVTVEDIEPPVITGFDEPMVLWPPNHKYTTVTAVDLVQAVTDNCTELSPEDLVITQVTSSEPDNETGVGDGNTVNDVVLASDGRSVNLRNERQGGGNGRVYTVLLEATDEWGNSTEASFEVLVPHSQSGGW